MLCALVSAAAAGAADGLEVVLAAMPAFRCSGGTTRVPWSTKGGLWQQVHTAR